MSSAWDCVAKAYDEDGKFSARFEGHEMAMDAPSLDRLRLCASAELLREGNLNFRSGFDGDTEA